MKGILGTYGEKRLYKTSVRREISGLIKNFKLEINFDSDHS